jgi:hypothetical protein
MAEFFFFCRVEGSWARAGVIIIKLYIDDDCGNNTENTRLAILFWSLFKKTQREEEEEEEEVAAPLVNIFFFLF